MPSTIQTSITLVATLLLCAAQAANAQSADPAWLDQLSTQLAVEEDCLAEYYLNIKEGKLAGRLTFEARAQCADGRQFDASRTEPAAKFIVSKCDTQVC